MVTVVPAAGVVLCCDSIQSVSPTEVLIHSWRMIWFGPSVRATAPSQSLPTPKTKAPSTVVTRDVVGAPVAAPLALDAPIPSEPANAITVIVCG